MENLITVLNSLGFTENEAKVYIALLQTGPQNGYEVSKSSGVPRSKVYVLLERLVNKGVLSNSHNGRNVIYKAEPVSRIEKMAVFELQKSLDVLRSESSKINEIGDDDQIWHLSGYDKVLLRVAEMIEEAQEEILIQIWKPELIKAIESRIRDKETTAKVAVILYDESQHYEHSLQNVFTHGFEKRLLEENEARWLTVVIDSKEVIYATIPNTQQTSAIHTKNKSMVWFSQEYVRHDAFCLKMLRDFPEETRQQYGDDMRSLRDIFTLQ
ncbi:TrmB family transcriptional regulator [Erysipelothrix sp. HDW6A]|uniref:TrmB family transcriptional regulator n=1 Tax=Erysipelothrix sp. HDW6A TaxID=2714928 RepID=UPI00140744CF|nr:TrmB family transcriptional regulator [Erysipelothrix sp. HDW6A]QIK57230.1 TrmB family transcriptional regulator [Erysipelothrix sp. HDW6A]